MTDIPTEGASVVSATPGLNAAYQAAFNDYMGAATPQAKNDALARMEQAAIDGPQRAAAPAPNAAPLASNQAYRDALAKAMAAPTALAREAYMAELAQIAQQTAGAAPAAQEGPLEGLEPAGSIGDLPLPPTIAPHVLDQAAFESVREAAVAVGIPKAIWGEALAQAHEHAGMLQASEAEWNAHLDGVFAALDKTLGSPEARSAVVKDAAIFLNSVAAADPRLGEAADLMRLTPWGLTTAAQLHRSGVRLGKR